MLGIVRVGLLFWVCAACVAGQTVDDLIAKCPTSAEIAAINKDLPLSFEADPTAANGLVCHAENGSADLTEFPERMYQALLIIKQVPLNTPLPWTGMSLYDWLVSSLRGIRFRAGLTNIFCCDPARVINLKAPDASSYAAFHLDQWSDAHGVGLNGYVSNIVYETRHTNPEDPGYTCPGGTKEETISGLGSHSIELYMNEWFAEQTDDPFFSGKEPSPSPYTYKDRMRMDAVSLRDAAFCDPGDGIDLSHEKDFGSVPTGSQGPLHTVAVTATTANPVKVTRVELAGENPNSFKIVKNDCTGKTVSLSCVVLVQFWPLGAGPQTADLVVTDNMPGSPHHSTLAGTGISILPTPTIDHVANAASLSPINEVVAGEVVTIFGNNIAQFAATNKTNPVPTTLGGATVFIGGIPAPIFAATQNQLTVQVPWELAGMGGPVIVKVDVASQAATLTATIVGEEPALYAAGPQGLGRCFSLGADAGASSDPRPAPHAEYVSVFGTGLGPVTNTPPTGAAVDPTRSMNSDTLEPVYASINGIDAPVLSSGLVPGTVGLYRVNIKVDRESVGGGPLLVSISENGKTSNSITITCGLNRSAR